MFLILCVVLHHVVLLHHPLDGVNLRLVVFPNSNHFGVVLISSWVNFLVIIIIVCILLCVICVCLLCDRLKLGDGDVGRDMIIIIGDGEVVECILDGGPVDVWFDLHGDLLILL
jgi:hypothetical protein